MSRIRFSGSKRLLKKDPTGYFDKSNQKSKSVLGNLKPGSSLKKNDKQPPDLDDEGPEEAIAEAAGAGADSVPKNEEYLYTEHGYRSFKDALKFDTNRAADPTNVSSNDLVEKAFVNEWDRHKNVKINRTHSVLLEQAYDMSFGDDEIKRIRQMLPFDSRILKGIRLFGEDILLGNFTTYLMERRRYFWSVIRWSIIVGIVTIALGMLGWFFVAPDFLNLFSMDFQASRIGGILCLVVLTSALAALTAYLAWKKSIAEDLDRQRNYYKAAISTSATKMKGYLSTIQQQFVAFSSDAQKELVDIKTRGTEFIEQSKTYVRLIVWYPVRLGLIESYYRAYVDNYLEESAKQVLRSDMLVLARREARKHFIGSAMVGFVPTAAGLYAENSTLFMIGLLWAVTTTVVGAVGYFWIHSPQHSSSHYIPVEVKEYQHELRNRRFLGLLAGGLPITLATIITAVMINSDIEGLVADMNLPLLWFEIAFGISLLFSFMAFLDNVISWKLYKDDNTRKKYNGNVIEVIKGEMDSADWDAFNKLRSDLKMADIYESVFSALQEERAKRR